VAARHKRQALSELGIARSTYYRWRQGQQCDDLVPHSGEEIRPWNRITPEEDGKILAAARDNVKHLAEGTGCTVSIEKKGDRLLSDLIGKALHSLV